MHNNAPSMTSIELLTHGQSTLGITDEKLGMAIGCHQSKAISVVNFLKRGILKFPIATVIPVASLLNIEPAMLLRAVLRESMPEVLAAVDAVLVPTELNANERNLIDSYRHLSEGHDVTPLIIEGTSIIALVVA